jgi:hypothetical protein
VAFLAKWPPRQRLIRKEQYNTKVPGSPIVRFIVLPVEAGAVELDAFALGRSRVEQARKPGQRHAQRAAIAQLDPHRVLVKSNCRRRNAHSITSRSGLGVRVVALVDEDHAGDEPIQRLADYFLR